MERKSLSMLWRESGKPGTFAEFSTAFNAKNFKNFTGIVDNSMSNTAGDVFQKADYTQSKMAIFNQNNLSADQMEANKMAATTNMVSGGIPFSKREGALWLGLGIAAGVVATLLAVKYLK